MRGCLRKRSRSCTPRGPSPPYERCYDWRATVVYDEPISDADKARIATLGGRVIDHLENLNFLRVELPNASFPELRESPNVVMVEASGQVCEIE